jgi:hypothetical protein
MAEYLALHHGVCQSRSHHHPLHTSLTENWSLMLPSSNMHPSRQPSRTSHPKMTSAPASAITIHAHVPAHKQGIMLLTTKCGDIKNM